MEKKNAYKLLPLRTCIVIFATLLVCASHIPTANALYIEVDKYVSTDSVNWYESIAIDESDDVYYKIEVSYISAYIVWSEHVGLDDVDIGLVDDLSDSTSWVLWNVDEGDPLVWSQIFGPFAITEDTINTVTATFYFWYNISSPPGWRQLEQMSDTTTVTVNTSTSVPDASIMLLLGSSLIGLGVFSRKSKRR